MNLLRSQNRISELMLRFREWIKHATAMDRTDANKVAETIVIPLFAEVYSYTDLKNLNYTQGSNYFAIDLGDETARVAFQITSTSRSEKIKETLRKFIERELYRKYDKLIIYILTEKQPSYTGKGYQEIIQGKFTFDKDKDIWDYRNILKEVANFQIDKARKVERILEDNFGEGRTLTEWEVVDNVERIVNEYTQLFVGREEESQKLDKFLSENSSGVMLVTAGAGFGKTALLANWVNAWRDKDCFIAYHFFTQRYGSVKSAYRNLLRQLYIHYRPTYEQISNDDEEHLKITLYNLLREYGTREGKPLIIVIDGLDEAEKTFSPPFPTPLPENVFVIASARAEKGEEHKYLEYWTDNSQMLPPLERLSCGAITQWLRNTDELAAFAEDTHFVAQLDEITQGFPLYLRYLTEELSRVQGQDVREVLAQTPKGFEQYVEQQLRRLDELDLPDERWQFFALLAVAKGVLEKEDIKALTGMRDRQLRQLHQSWQATRWMRITEGKLYAFAHPLLATTFAAQLGDDAEDALQALIDYCAKWQKYQSHYALRHYAEHLRDVKRWEELYAIARNEDFAVTQGEHLPDEPDLPLKTVQIALQGAADIDNARAIAEFLLVHARRLVQTTSQESPLDVLRKGNLNRALALANLYDIERCVLWYLLLVWELNDTDRLGEAQTTLEKLRKKKLVRGFSLSVGTDDVRVSYVQYAAYMLAYVSEVSKDAFKDLTKRLLLNNGQLTLCKTLIGRGHYHLKTALETALSMDDDLSKVQALADIAVAQAQNGDKTVAQNTLNFILETAQSFDDKWSWTAVAQAKVGDFDTALEVARKIENEEKQAWTLGQIAIAQAQAGKKKEAQANLALALDTARKINIQYEWQRAYALQKVAIAQAEAGEFDHALATAIETGWECTRGNVLTSIVRVYAQAGDVKTALKIVGQMESEKPDDPSIRSWALVAIAEVFARNRNLNAALGFVTLMVSDHARAIGVIAATLAQVGAGDVARDTLSLILKNTVWMKPPQQKQAEALSAIAQVQVEIGHTKESQATFNIALAMAQKINNEGSKDWALQTISRTQLESGNPTAALKTAQMIHNTGSKLVLLPLIAIAHGQDGDKDTAQKIFTESLEIARKVLDKSSKEAILREIAKGQAQVGDFDAALETAQENGRDFTQPQVVGVIAQVQAWDGKEEAARATFTAAVQEARKLSKSWEQAWTLQTIAEAQAQTQSEEFLNAALRTAREIDAQREKEKAMQAIAKMQIQLRQFRAALETAREIQAEGEQAVEVLAIVAEAQVQTEGREAAQNTYFKALKLVQETLNDGTQARVLETVAKSQAKSSFGSQAIRTIEMVLINRNQHLPNVAKVLAEKGDKENFKHLLIPCAYYLDAAYEMCGHLAQLYPEQAAAVAIVVSELN